MKKVVKKKVNVKKELNNKKFAEYIANKVIYKLNNEMQLLMQKINQVNVDYLNNIHSQHNRFEEMMIKRQSNFEDLLRAQLIRVADDAIKANYSLQRLTQLIDDTLFTPEVRQRIINQMRMDIGSKNNETIAV